MKDSLFCIMSCLLAVLSQSCAFHLSRTRITRCAVVLSSEYSSGSKNSDGRRRRTPDNYNPWVSNDVENDENEKNSPTDKQSTRRNKFGKFSEFDSWETEFSGGGRQPRTRSTNKGTGSRRQETNSSWEDTNKYEDGNDDAFARPQRQQRTRANNDDGKFSSRRNYDDYNRNNNNRRTWGDGRENSRDRYSYSRIRTSNPRGRPEKAEEKRTNLKELEEAGFVHLYGLSSVLNALKANRRDFGNVNEAKDDNDNGQEAEIKPEAQLRPWLFIQERTGSGQKRQSEKAAQAQDIVQLAYERNIPIAIVDKGVLNTLSGNRPHQGYVLRCGPLEFEPMNTIPTTTKTSQLWLALDEVVDPQNLGALLRSAYFLGCHGILVCAKNSAPPSPTVSAASAGALELLDVYSTNNLPRTLDNANNDGFRIIGASCSVPKDMEDDIPLYDLQECLPLQPDDPPTILVLGSEGHGLRTLVAKSCTEFVRIPGALGGGDGVDSLNVSVTGGILLWHFLFGKGSPNANSE